MNQDFQLTDTSARAGSKMSQIMVTLALVGTLATLAQWHLPILPTPMIPT
jgi:hypothetical protein